MAKRDQDFFDRVWDVVAQIPHGKVTTYGHIAEFLGTKSAARTVGWALNGAKGTGLPAHRVVNRYGALSGWRSPPWCWGSRASTSASRWNDTAAGWVSQW